MKLAEIQLSDLRGTARALRPGDEALSADLRALLRFAQLGAGAAEARPRFERVMRVLFAELVSVRFDPMRARIRTPDASEAPDAARAVAIMRAARGRYRLEGEGEIDAPDLAALAGVDESYVRRMAREGRLKRSKTKATHRDAVVKPGRNAPITAASAIELLRERSVAPYGSAS